MTINKGFRADGGDIGTGRLKEIADNPYGDEEKCWLAKRVLALLDELEAVEKQIAELKAREETLRPVGVMSEKAFHRLEGSESRFIALWPRPGIYLPRKRPDDGVIVYARTAAGIKGE